MGIERKKICCPSTPGSELTGELFELNGFENKNNSQISFNDSLRKLTITPILDYHIWVNGDQKTITSIKEIIIDNITGFHYIYFDENSDLINTMNFSNDIILKYCWVTIIYWNATIGQSISFAEERHGMIMDGETHLHLHSTEGTLIVARPQLGFVFENFIVDGDGSLDTHAQFSSANGSLRDQDLLISITDGNPQDISPILKASIFYRQSTGVWYKDIISDFAAKRYGTGRLAYNEFTGTIWQQTEVTNEYYIVSIIIATNNINLPIIALQGTKQYETLSDVKIGIFDELNNFLLTGLSFLEFIFLGAVVFQTSNSYTNTIKARIVNVDGQDYIDLRQYSKKNLITTETTVIKNATLVGKVVFGTILNPVILTVDVDDYNPVDAVDPTKIFQDSNRVNVTSTVNILITGFDQTGVSEGQLIIITNSNINGKRITLKNQDANSLPENQLYMKLDKDLDPGEWVFIIRDFNLNRWFVS